MGNIATHSLGLVTKFTQLRKGSAKMTLRIKKDANGQKYIETTKTGYALVHDPILNKGSSFTQEELDTLSLRGIVAPNQAPLEQVVEKCFGILNAKSTPLEKHIYLRSLQDRNETLYYALVCKYPVEIMPLIYTPTVGEACQKFSEIYRRPRGLFIRYEDRDRLDEVFAHEQFDDTEIIVVTDGGRILGLGDQGAGGMGIPIGKLSLYTGCAGIAPQKTLPILLDVGTDNEELLNNPLYIGSRHKRISEEQYFEFVDIFVKAVMKHFPNVMLQWEDFAQPHALNILNKYRDQLCTFNDDIQGTAAIVVGALLAATKAAKSPITEQKVVVVGAGSAGVGISNLIIQAMVDAGMTEQQAYDQVYLVDRFGLLTDRLENKDFQIPFVKSADQVSAWKVADPNNITLLETVKHTKATMILGVCAQGGIFSEAVIKQMAENCEHPIVFPISNPTDKAEAKPVDVQKWTDGKAIIGTGSPFPDLIVDGKSRRVDQVNNSYIFPAMGLAVTAVGAKRVTDHMFLTAAQALAEISPSCKDPKANLLPPLTEIRAVSKHVAFAVAREAVQAGLSGYAKDLSDAQIMALIDDTMWEPVYLPYKYVAS